MTTGTRKRPSESPRVPEKRYGMISRPLPNPIENAVQNYDWVVISNGYPSPSFRGIPGVLILCIEFEKLKRLIGNNCSKQGRKYFLRTIIALGELQMESYGRKNVLKVNATNGRALNTFRQRIIKAHREYGEEIKRFREGPRIF